MANFPPPPNNISINVGFGMVSRAGSGSVQLIPGSSSLPKGNHHSYSSLFVKGKSKLSWGGGVGAVRPTVVFCQLL